MSLYKTVPQFFFAERRLFLLGAGLLLAISTAAAAGPIRIETGSTTSYTDASGNVWEADRGFAGGTTVNRGAIAIANTLDDKLYQTERYGMSAYAISVPNGAYVVRLHFAETYTGITGPGQRVFTVAVEGVSLGSIDVFAQAGGRNIALIKQWSGSVNDGVLNIAFAATANNAIIDALEIIPSTPTPRPTSTATPAPTSTATTRATPTSTATARATATNIATATATARPSATATSRPSATATATSTPTPTATSSATATATLTATPTATIAGSFSGIRIEAGGSAAYRDTSGNVWEADRGFSGGTVADRGAIEIANSLDDRIFQTERWGMTGYRIPVPNGSYRVRLYFAETYTGITAAGQRVFDVTVENTTINGIDIFAQTGGRNSALIKEVTVTVADGALDIAFTNRVNNALINGIEIVDSSKTPQPLATKKKGIGFASFDASLFNPGWCYDWGYQPGANAAPGVQFVPMILAWAPLNDALNQQKVEYIASNGYKFALFLNEPDHPNNGSITPEVESANFAEFNLFYSNWEQANGVKAPITIGSPAVTGLDPNWLPTFMSLNNNSSKIGFIALHLYLQSTDVDAYMKYVDAAHTQYNKPVWITEFAPVNRSGHIIYKIDPITGQTVDAFSSASVQTFMRLIMKKFDETPYVQRYAWQAIKESWTMGATSALFKGDGSTQELTDLGKIYAAH